MIPGGIMFSLFGFTGQYVYNIMDAQRTEEFKAGPMAPKENFAHWLAGKKWSPFSVLSDEAYEKLLMERMLKIDVEVALIDDRIRELEQKPAVTLDAGANVAEVTAAGRREGP